MSASFLKRPPRGVPAKTNSIPAESPQLSFPPPRYSRNVCPHSRGIPTESAGFPLSPFQRRPQFSDEVGFSTAVGNIPLRSISSRGRSIALFGVVGGSRQSPVPGDETAWKYFTKQQLGDDKLHYTPSICHWLRRNVACPRLPWTLRPDESIAQGVSGTCFPLKCPPYPWETSWTNTT